MPPRKRCQFGDMVGHDGLQAYVGTHRGPANVQMRPVRRFSEDYQMSKEKPLNPLTMTDEELIEHCDKQVQALRMALDMIECEKHDRRHVRWAIVDALKEWKPALAEQPAQQEPVAYGIWDTMLGKDNRMMMVRLDKGQDGCTVPLYTSPPAQRTWVGLTDEEIQTEWVLTPQNDRAEGIWFGRRIEAKLKEKNT